MQEQSIEVEKIVKTGEGLKLSAQNSQERISISGSSISEANQKLASSIRSVQIMVGDIQDAGVSHSHIAL